VNGLADWVRNFRGLHERARQGALRPGEESTYHTLRDELARAMLAAQKLSLRPGETARKALRVARALQIELKVGAERERTLTLDLSTGGFSALLSKPPVLGELVGVSLRLNATETLTCRATLVDVKPLTGSARVAGRFVDLAPADLERLEMLVIDVVLEMFAP